MDGWLPRRYTCVRWGRKRDEAPSLVGSSTTWRGYQRTQLFLFFRLHRLDLPATIFIQLFAKAVSCLMTVCLKRKSDEEVYLWINMFCHLGLKLINLPHCLNEKCSKSVMLSPLETWLRCSIWMSLNGASSSVTGQSLLPLCKLVLELNTNLGIHR